MKLQKTLFLKYFPQTKYPNTKSPDSTGWTDCSHEISTFTLVLRIILLADPL